VGMEKFERWIERMSRTFEWVGAVGLLVMALVNILDVIGAKFFKWPFPGAVEIVSFAQIVAIALTIPMGLFLGFHLTIDFVIEKLPKSLKSVVNIIVSILCVVFFILVFFQALEYAYSLQKSREIGSVSKIPLFPFAYVIALGIVPVILFYVIRSIRGIKRK
jgi:TRAP-type C4-dicarboxylate transport system permease small subunit